MRHNLSSGRAFLKMERCGGDRGKGFFWSIDHKYAQTLEDQEAKALQNAAQGAGVKDGLSKPGKRRDKHMPLDPPLKRSIKGEPKGPLPPPLTSTPLLSRAMSVNTPQVSTSVLAPNQAATGVFVYNVQGPSQSSSSSTPHATTVSSSNPYATLARSNWPLYPSAAANVATSVSIPSPAVTSLATTTLQATSTPTISANASTPPATDRPTLPPINTSLVPDVSIPIVLGPIPVTHPDHVPGQPNNSAKPGYMILHERKLILDPDVFSSITQDMLKQLEKIGAMAAVQVLTGHMVRALKERRAKNKNKDKSAKKASKAAKKAAAAAASATLPVLHAASSSTNAAASPLLVPVPQTVEDTVSSADPGSPVIVIDDPEDEAPATKRRKLNDGGMHTTEMIPMMA